MKLAGWKRTLLAGLVTLSVVAPSVATFTAGHAFAYSDKDNCTPLNARCGPPRWEN